MTLTDARVRRFHMVHHGQVNVVPGTEPETRRRRRRVREGVTDESGEERPGRGRGRLGGRAGEEEEVERDGGERLGRLSAVHMDWGGRPWPAHRMTVEYRPWPASRPTGPNRQAVGSRSESGQPDSRPAESLALVAKVAWQEAMALRRGDGLPPRS